ncbi:restriction endonuclease subunit S [Bacillus velezensis]|uniref:restriction endonuclease subunit S n=1 Tax=Bacillus velezensis TaxID=492670 RepID=UPI000BA6ED6B|nr:restriction endonuclease subunit S [Bacillus velezensis]PAE99522.1 hypothetical protein CHH68_18170 [Bacillus velezensis]
MGNKRVPEVRFEGFNGEWEERNLGDNVEFYSGLTYSPDNIVEKGTLVLRSSNVKNGEIVNADNVYVDPKVVNSRNVEAGDIIVVVRNGSRNLIGKHASVKKKMDNTVIGAFMTGIRSKESSFTNALLDTNQFAIEINKNLGATINQITTGEFKKMKFSFPSNDEQKKVGNFFKQLDDMIALHQQELTTLKQTKQGFLQKMFPKEGESVPEVRFPGFDGEWEEQKLDSIVDRVKSYVLSRDVETTEYTGYKYIHYGDIHTKVADIIDEFSDLPNIKAGNYELLKKGDLVLADASEDYQGIAAPAVITIDVPYKLVSGLHTIALRPKQIDSLFLYYLINSQTFRKYGYKAGTGMKVFGISATNLLRFESVFPTFEEQTKIGNFFKELDDIITLHQRELDALKETKKAFLQKMFV